MRIVFFGSPDFAIPTLQALHQSPDFAVAAVVSQPDKPKGRGQKKSHCPVAVFAQEQHLNFHPFAQLRSPLTYQLLKDYQADFFIVAAYGRILPPTLLTLPTYGCINIHASLLPRHRGASPIIHAICQGDQETGISIMLMDEGLDTGPVYAQSKIAIDENDTSATLTTRLAVVGSNLLMQKLPHIIAGTLHATVQDATAASYAGMVRKQDGQLNFSESATILARKIRAFIPWPRCFCTTMQGKRLQILAATALESAAAPRHWLTLPAQHGRVVDVGAQGIVVACEQSYLRITRLQPEGGRSMPAASFVAGRSIGLGQLLWHS